MSRCKYCQRRLWRHLDKAVGCHERCANYLARINREKGQ